MKPLLGHSFVPFGHGYNAAFRAVCKSSSLLKSLNLFAYSTQDCPGIDGNSVNPVYLVDYVDSIHRRAGSPFANAILEICGLNGFSAEEPRVQ